MSILPPLFFESVIDGLILGFIYALMSVGLTLIFSIMKLSNFAHGEVYMLGGYALYYISSLFPGINPILGLPMALAVGFVVGSVFEVAYIRDAFVKPMERPFEYAMLATFALSIFLQNFALQAFGSFVHTAPSFVSGSILLGYLTLSLNRVVLAVVATISLLLLYLFIKYTKTGRAWRAVAQNRIGALVSGIDDAKVRILAYGTGTSLAALSGALLATIYGIWPSCGFEPLVIAFVVITLGGLGSIKGAFIGSLVVGLINSFVAIYASPSYAYVVMYLALILVLIIRPSGLFGEKG